MKTILVASTIVIIILNVYSTIRVWRKDDFEKKQKMLQSIIIWLFPIIGALLILIFIKDDETPKGPYNPNDSIGSSSAGGGV